MCPTDEASLSFLKNMKCLTEQIQISETINYYYMVSPYGVIQLESNYNCISKRAVYTDFIKDGGGRGGCCQLKIFLEIV